MFCIYLVFRYVILVYTFHEIKQKEALMLSLNNHENYLEILKNYSSSKSDFPFISVYIKRKNLTDMLSDFDEAVKQVENQLLDDYPLIFDSKRKVREFLGPWQELKNLDFWSKGGFSVGIFITKDFKAYLKLSEPVTSKIIIAKSFHIKPLLSFMNYDQPFYLLSLSKKSVILYKGGHQSVLTRIFTYSNTYLKESSEAILKNREGEMIKQFLLRSEEQIQKILSKDRYPVILAGTTQIVSLFKKIARDPDLLTYTIKGNIEDWSDVKRHKACLENLEKYMVDSRSELYNAYLEKNSLGKTLNGIREIAKASHKGMVQQLFIANDRHVWGDLDRKTAEISLDLSHHSNTIDDLLDDIAEMVLDRGGKVVAIPFKEMPSKTLITAILR